MRRLYFNLSVTLQLSLIIDFSLSIASTPVSSANPDDVAGQSSDICKRIKLHNLNTFY